MRLSMLPLLMPVLALGADPAPAPTDAAIEREIQLLGSEDFNEREAAQSWLKDAGLPAERALTHAAGGTDAEVKLRAEQLLVNVRWLKMLDRDRIWFQTLGPTLGTSKPGDPVRKSSPGNGPPVESSNSILDEAVSWLARNQEADGHWDSQKYGAQSEADIEQTALAILALHESGNTEKMGRYEDNVVRALTWLRTQQREDGAFAKPNARVDGIAHAIAGWAMAEAAGCARKPETIQSAQRAIEYSIKHHQIEKNGQGKGFARYVNSKEVELFTNEFFLLQFKTAYVAQLRFDPQVFEGLRDVFTRCEIRDGSRLIGYANTPGGERSIKASILGGVEHYSLGGRPSDLRDCAEWIRTGFKPSADASDSDALMTFLGSLVFFQVQGDAWKAWREEEQEHVLPKACESGVDAGSWDSVGVWASGGRVLSTALYSMSFDKPLRNR